MGSKADVSRITVHSCPSRTAQKLAAAWVTTRGTILRTTLRPVAPPPVRPDHPSFPAQGQVGYRGSQIQLESRLDPAEIAGLANAQLDQPGQPVFHHTAHSIFVMRTGLSTTTISAHRCNGSPAWAASPGAAPSDARTPSEKRGTEGNCRTQPACRRSLHPLRGSRGGPR